MGERLEQRPGVVIALAALIFVGIEVWALSGIAFLASQVDRPVLLLAAGAAGAVGTLALPRRVCRCAW